ncbi:MAG TPA: PAS domain S-box protein [Candidatus Binatia bacterium]|jgi:PAS domain S-box-containing protein|nr:PAS domain S-box protein [Candidatus Binatia bacterium]
MKTFEPSFRDAGRAALAAPSRHSLSLRSPEDSHSIRLASKELRVLFVEDYENDVLLLQEALRDAGYEPVCHRVETREAMSEALERQKWDLVIADYKMPAFDGLEALGLVKAMGLDLPFIVVSGQITESTAVAAMKAGAHDYVMKDNLARLGPAVERELREAEGRRERRRAQEKLHIEQVFRRAIENSVPSGIAAVDLEGRQTYVNPAFCAMVGWSEQELVGARPPFLYWPPEQIETIAEALGKVVQSEPPGGSLELRFRRRNGERLDVLLQITPLKDAFENITGWVSSASDITERKRAETRLAADYAITRILANAPSLEEAGPRLLQVLLGGLEVDLGVLWIPDPHGQILQPAVLDLRIHTPSLEMFVEASRHFTFARGVSLPGRVWEQRRAIWVPDVKQEPALQRRNAALHAGLQSALAFPIQNASDFFGVLEFFTVRRVEEDATLRSMMAAVGSEIGQFIQRRNAEDALRHAHAELELRVQQRTAELKAANAKLQAAITDRKRLENELLEITEKERRRIGLDLHDDLGQKLSGIALMTKGLELKLGRQRTSEAQDAAKIHALIQEAMSHASDLAHDMATLDQPQKDLPSALSDLAAHARELFRITCRFTMEGAAPSLDPSLVAQFYKIAQEAVTNGIKHGKARRVGIHLASGSGGLVLTIQNNGVPFPDLRSQSTGMGLRIMNYRASLIGASLEVRGLGTRGTLVTCALPLAK